MKDFHVMCGLPRAGSTLLANVLDQNPDVHVSATSCLPVVLASSAHVLSQSPELKSELINDREGTEARIRAALRGLVDGWYSKYPGKVVFDKSRLWNHQLRLLQWLYPEANMVVCVRDLRAVLGNVEQHHAKTGIFDESPTPLEKTLFARANALLDGTGLIGMCVNGVEDMIRRRPGGVIFLKYEEFVKHPKTSVRAIYEEMGLDDFEHDFDNVENTTGTDVDGLYLHKFPHEGSGKVEDRDPDWEKWVSPDLAKQMITQFVGYNTAFNYTAE